ncbi:hypothetical protein HDU92_001782 [Lobulomyces angularis]|nr:hypothetical protein HDU92_001782 [Lobulomyces angularis]
MNTITLCVTLLTVVSVVFILTITLFFFSKIKQKSPNFKKREVQNNGRDVENIGCKNSEPRGLSNKKSMQSIKSNKSSLSFMNLNRFSFGLKRITQNFGLYELELIYSKENVSDFSIHSAETVVPELPENAKNLIKNSKESFADQSVARRRSSCSSTLTYTNFEYLKYIEKLNNLEGGDTP